MKILQIIPALNKGGAERLVLDICIALQKKKGIEVKLITFRKDNSYSFLTQEIDWEIVPAMVQLSISGKSKIETSKLQNAIEKFQPDVIHSHLFESEMVLSQINYPSAKYIVHFHDNMVQYENFSLQTLLNKRRLTNFFEKITVLKAYKNRSTQFIAISKNNYQFIEVVLPKHYNKSLLHNAINLDRFNHEEQRHSKIVLTMIGSLVNKKGQILAIETLAELHKRNHLIFLNMLGEGSNRIMLTELIEKYGLENYIEMPGNVDHPETYLQDSTIYLHTASYEPFGLVLIEAMACGLPVVCTDGKGNRDLIIEGENGFMVWERDPKLLADKIELLINNPPLRLKMGQNARKFAEGFGIDNYVEKLIEIYLN